MQTTWTERDRLEQAIKSAEQNARDHARIAQADYSTNGAHWHTWTSKRFSDAAARLAEQSAYAGTSVALVQHG